MRILHTVEQYHPSIGGMQEVVKQLSERLVARGHDVTVATSAHPGRDSATLNGVKVASFEISGNAVQGYRWGEVEKYRRFLLDSRFDVVVNFAAQQWATDIALPILPQIKGRKVFVPTGFSALYEPHYQSYFRDLAERMRAYDATIFLSEDYRDIHFAREHGIDNLHIIPNGASEEEFSGNADRAVIRARLGISRDELFILHVGSHTGVKGHADAMDLMMQARIPKATLLIVGNNCLDGCGRSCRVKARLARWLPFVQTRSGPLGALFSLTRGILSGRFLRSYRPRKRILVRELSRLDTVAAYRAADLFLFPSNIECSPIVLFECMASRLPFVTSEVGNTREIISWSGAGVLLPTRCFPNRALIDIPGALPIFEALCRDPDRRKELGSKGYTVWKDRFTWEKIALEYERVYLDGGRAPAD